MENLTLLKDLAHALSPGDTRAIKHRDQLIVYDDTPVEADDGVVVVAQLADGRHVTGKLKMPSEGWVEIDGTVYPSEKITVRGPVVMIVRSAKD